jgi:hypothetical protein
MHVAWILPPARLGFLAGIGEVGQSEHDRNPFERYRGDIAFLIENHVWDFGLTVWDNCVISNGK